MHSFNKFIAFAMVLLCSVQFGSSIKCYHCNSNDNKNCEDPFDTDSHELISQDCSLLFPNENSTFCRKTIHRVSLKEEYNERVIRTCGFIEERRFGGTDGDGDDDDDNEETQGKYRCYLKPGTFGVENLYCACEEDNCNGVGKLNIQQSAIALISLCVIMFNFMFS